MALTDLIPWSRNRSLAPPRSSDDSDPFLSLHREMNRMFDDFARGFGFGVPSRLSGSAWGSTWPRVEIDETDKEGHRRVARPRTEKRRGHARRRRTDIEGREEGRGNGALYSERWQGQFQRSFEIGPEVDPDKVNASFKNGVLTVTMAKVPEAQSQVKRIPIAA